MYASDLKHPVPGLEDKLHRLYTLNRHKKIDLTFRPPFINLLQAFGNPQHSLPPVIHVAGTNGKGSVIAILRSILEAGGYKVHAYTSPHLRRFNERLYLAGAEIEDGPLEELVDEALRLNAGSDVTFFEITTALAFAAFSRTPADICLLEVGLGGRLDCTNVIEKPLVTIINSISYDHQEHLGDTLSEIAAEKAGIMKGDVPCIIGPQNKYAIDEGIINVFEDTAQQKNAPLYVCDADWFIEKQGRQIRFSFDDQDSLLPHPNLTGRHQIDNAGTALAALHLIEKDFPLETQAIKQGLAQARWRARLQRLDAKLFDLPQGWEIWLDGGHNQSAGEMLAAQSAIWQENDPKPLHLVLSMMKHKDPETFVRPLLPYVNSITITGIPDEPDAYAAQALQDEVSAFTDKTPLKTAQNFEHAVSEIKKTAEDGRILIAGSLYMAGHVLQAHQNTP